MATENWSSADGIAASLEERPYDVGFYQVMRMLEAAHPELPPFGKSRQAKDDPVRIAQAPSLEFAPSTLAFCDRSGPVPRLGQFFFGLLGPNGPLPTHISEYAIDRERSHRDPTFTRFLDVFHHRLGMLFYRIWADAEPAADLGREDQRRFERFVASLLGIGSEALRGRDAQSDLSKLFLVGQFVNGPRHPEGLLAILAHMFEMPVALQEFRGDWLRLPREAVCRLGQTPDAGTLGVNLVLGSRVYECQHSFEIEFGPLSLHDFESLLPTSGRVQRLIAVLRNYLNDEFDWQYRLTLRKDEVPPLRLGQYGQLGWSTWLNAEQRAQDPRDFFHAPLGMT